MKAVTRDRTALLAGTVAFVLASLYLGVTLANHVGRVVNTVPYVPELAWTDSPPEVQAAMGDGQGYLMLAWDPLLERPGSAGADSAAYRASRPLLSYVVWLLALGDPARTPWSLYAAAALAAGAAAWSLARLSRYLDVNPGWSVIALAFCPGTFISLQSGGAELLMLAFAAAGIANVLREANIGRVPWTAVAALTAAMLVRETALVFVVAVAAWAILERERTAIRLLLAPAAYSVWCLLVWWRYGVPTWHAPDGAFGLAFLSAPFDSLDVAAVMVIALSLVGLGLRRGPWTWIAALHLGLLSVLGPAVWARFQDYSRVMMPVTALGIMAIMGAVFGHREQPSNGRAPTGVPGLVPQIEVAPAPHGKNARESSPPRPA